jgi:hypothetical protein
MTTLLGFLAAVVKFILDSRKLQAQVSQISRDAKTNNDDLRYELKTGLVKLNGGLVHFLDGLPFPAWLKQEVVIDKGLPTEHVEFRMVHLNERYTESFGKTLGAYQGRTDYEIWPEDVAQEFFANDYSVLTSGREDVFTEQVKIGNENVLGTFIKLPVVNGKLRGVAGFVLPNYMQREGVSMPPASTIPIL